MTKGSQLAGDLEAMATENRELKASLRLAESRARNAELERDYYFSKMRDIEIIVQLARAGEGLPLDIIERVLYSEDGSSLQVKQGDDGKYHIYTS
jgi:hypothetical protein